LIDNENGTKMPRYTCAAVFMLIISVVFFVVGITLVSLASYTVGVTKFGGYQIIQGYSLSTIYAMLVTGIVFLFSTILAMYASCNPVKIFSKIILLLIALFTGLLAVVQCAFILVGLVWLDVINVNITEIVGSESILNFNNTVKEIEVDCCTNTSIVLHDMCDHIISNNTLAYYCANYDEFYTAVVLFAGKFLKLVCIVLGVTALFESIMSITSYRLMCLNKRVMAYYRPRSSYDNSTVQEDP
jgi:hypothetical protein